MLAQTFFYAELIEQWGSGTTRMIAACRAQGLPDPEFSEFMGGFRVVFSKDPYTPILRSMEHADQGTQPPEYSKRLGRLRPEQFQAALARFGLGDFVAAEPIPFGLFGQNVFITSARGAFVLRGCPHYDWQFPAERFFARLLHERTAVPVPWPYLLEPRRDIFGWPFIIMPRMPGLQLANPATVAALSMADRLGIACALGENLAAMQELTWPQAGRYDLAADDILPFPHVYADEVRSNIRDYLQRAQSYNNRTTDADVAWVEEVIAAAGDTLEAPFQPCFVMRDYKTQNVTVMRDGTGWKVSGVFDLMEGSFGDGELDLCRPVAMYLEEEATLARAFVAAYLQARPARPGLRQRLPVYMLVERLLVWQYFQRPSNRPFWDPTLTLREWASPYLAAWAGLLA